MKIPKTKRKISICFLDVCCKHNTLLQPVNFHYSSAFCINRSRDRQGKVGKVDIDLIKPTIWQKTDIVIIQSGTNKLLTP